MPIMSEQLRKCCFCAAVTAVLVAVSGVQAWGQPIVINGDFEADTELWTVWPGYVAGGGVNPENISGWTGDGGRGINPVVPAGPTDAPFRDNGNNSTSIAFLQGASHIEQAVSGFTIGADYILSLEFNSRNCCGDVPIGTIYLNGIEAGSTVDLFPAPGGIPPVGGDNPWYSADIEFEAPTDTITLRIQAAPAAGGDATMIVDNVRFTLVPEPTGGLMLLLGAVGLMASRRRQK
jgi:hypothetical protein